MNRPTPTTATLPLSEPPLSPLRRAFIDARLQHLYTFEQAMAIPPLRMALQLSARHGNHRRAP